MKSTVESIVQAYPITAAEYAELEKRYGDLYLYASWQLIKKNQKTHCNDPEDFAQELRFALIIAAAYFKRQTYIEAGLKLAKQYCNNETTRLEIEHLEHLWNNKTRHGANRQIFGSNEEKILDILVEKYVPEDKRPLKDDPLRLDTKRFNTYCKAIVWNKQKALGKQITKEKSIRANQVSINEFDYLATV